MKSSQMEETVSEIDKRGLDWWKKYTSEPSANGTEIGLTWKKRCSRCHRYEETSSSEILEIGDGKWIKQFL